MRRYTDCREASKMSVDHDKPMHNIIPYRRAGTRRREELAFLPAALEIV